MILEISSTRPPATDLGYLLHKNPARAQTFQLPFGTAYVYYPVATAELCTAALLLNVDPVSLVRGHSGPGRSAQEYVNDRPYVASSFLSVAISRQSDARRVVDLGCGEGHLLQALMKDPAFDQLLGVDVSHRALAVAAERLNLDRLAPKHFVREEPLYRVHECVFGVLALESEPVDPRL
jgi:SAM-dependent methyltransferase